MKLTDACAFETCERPSSEGGFCHSHYEQLRTQGTLKPLREYGNYVKGDIDCVLPSCKKPAVSQGFCASHLAMTQKYNLTVHELAIIWASPVCSNEFCDNTTRLHMDHDHETGIFRGLLCSGCNTSLGMLKENVNRIRGLAAYKELHS